MPRSAALWNHCAAAPIIRLAVDALGVEHGEIVHGLGVAGAGGGEIEPPGLGQVLLHALALFQQAAVAELRRRQSLGRRAFEPARRFVHVGRHAAPFGKAHADFVGGGGVAGGGGAAQADAADGGRQAVAVRRGGRPAASAAAPDRVAGREIDPVTVPEQLRARRAPQRRHGAAAPGCTSATGGSPAGLPPVIGAVGAGGCGGSAGAGAGSGVRGDRRRRVGLVGGCGLGGLVGSGVVVLRHFVGRPAEIDEIRGDLHRADDDGDDAGGDEHRFHPVHQAAAFRPWRGCGLVRVHEFGGAARRRAARVCCTAACAARRAAAMKLDLLLGTVAAAGRAPPRAASEAAIRAAGLARIGGGPEPGSSGWSGGRSGSIGNCRAAGMRLGGGGGGGGGSAMAGGCRGGGGRRRGGGGVSKTAAQARPAAPPRHRSAAPRACRPAPSSSSGSASSGGGCGAGLAVDALLDHRQAVDHVAERAMHGVERVLRARDFVLERVDRGRGSPRSRRRPCSP